MSPHIPEDLLTAFVEGNVGEQVAIHLAEHLDDCPACSNRVAALEPLSHAFALTEDPEVPDDLVPAILNAARRTETTPLTEFAVGAGLLTASAMMATGVGNPIGLVKDLAVVMSVATDVSRALGAGLSSSLALSTMVIAISVVSLALTLRMSEPQLVRLRRFS